MHIHKCTFAKALNSSRPLASSTLLLLASLESRPKPPFLMLLNIYPTQILEVTYFFWAFQLLLLLLCSGSKARNRDILHTTVLQTKLISNITTLYVDQTHSQPIEHHNVRVYIWTTSILAVGTRDQTNGKTSPHSSRLLLSSLLLLLSLSQPTFAQYTTQLSFLPSAHYLPIVFIPILTWYTHTIHT